MMQHIQSRETDTNPTFYVTFRLRYNVEIPGDVLCWMSDSLSCGDTPLQQMMASEGDGLWSMTIPLSVVQLSLLKYRYAVCRDGQILRIEAPVGHRISLTDQSRGGVTTILIADRWIDPSPWHRWLETPLASALGFSDQSLQPVLSFPISEGSHVGFYVDRPFDGPVRIVGSDTSLGAWEPDHAQDMTPAAYGYVLSDLSIGSAWEYKYALRTSDGVWHWEDGGNRILSADDNLSYDCVISIEESPHFETVGRTEITPLEGTVAPLFALRTGRSYGIGDLGDAVDFVSWLSSIGHSVYQMLPFYDTTFDYTARDSYPYNAITTYGLHPLYLDVRSLPFYAESEELRTWEMRAEVLNKSDRIQYEEVLQLKYEVMDACFVKWWAHGGSDDEDFCDFWEAEREQLLPYCLFCTLRDALRGKVVAGYPAFESAMVEWIDHGTVLGADARGEVMKHAFRQYYLDKQMRHLRAHAEEVGVMLKGDLPIGVSRDSVDVWQNPDLFHPEVNAGAPPDSFSKTGQNWGFPTYNWERMAEDNYAWWQMRLQSMSRYLHALRIDHVLGFFRIWSIPAEDGDPISGHYVPAIGYPSDDIRGLEPFFVCDAEGMYHPMLRPEGAGLFSSLTTSEKERLLWLRDSYYYDRNESLWRQTAIGRLSAILSASKMLICAEDLGLLPRSIKEVLSGLELLSLEVLRMPKHAGHDFVYPSDVPELSVMTTSTHDTSSLRAWWYTLSEEQQTQIASIYHLTENTPASLIQALRRVPSTMLILPLVDWCTLTGYGDTVVPEDEQINFPEIRHHIWNYRMYGKISDLPASLVG